MENIKAQPMELSLEEKQERQWRQKDREIKIKRTRANVLRSQITEAYSILENIRFDYLGDTAFREQIVKAKRGCESAISDFLLDDTYHNRKLTEHRKLSFVEYDEKLKALPTEPTQGTGK